ncbi:MAG: class I SAM-dependent methyltransferase [Candidatus Dormibacteraeota bacterium]|nr:class I SAM-dependent methyltransferase [Candidatus Dormibacteraeota bacterium]
MDALLDTDWITHWRDLVARREAEVPAREAAFWDRRAPTFALSTRGEPDPFLDFIEPWLEPSLTLIDVGAGVGRHAQPLARRLDWVTAVEPSAGMRDRLAVADNMTVVASGWMDADTAPADLVICVHVLYTVEDVVPFLRKLETAARRRLFVVLRDGASRHPAEVMKGPGGPRSPHLRDLFLLLRQLGVAPDLALFRRPAFFRFESVEAAVADCETRLGALFEQRGGRQWLVERLRPEPGGNFLFDAGEATTGVVHWSPSA